MLAAATGAGAWLAIVGWPDLGWGAAAELGVDLARTVAVHPVPAASWPNAMAALLDGFDLVLVASQVPSTPSVLRRLSARARERGSVLLCFHTGGAAGASVAERSWQGFGDVVVEASARGWEGLHEGAGRLRRRRVSLRVEGRRVMGRRRSSEMWLPSSLGAVEAFQAPSPVGVVPGDVPQASARGALRALTSVEAGA